MAEMTIQLRTDPATGKKDIIVSLRSDEDALPHEHEQQHRALVEKLIHGGIVQASELGKIVVERGQEEGQQVPITADEPKRNAQAEGNFRSQISDLRFKTNASIRPPFLKSEI